VHRHEHKLLGCISTSTGVRTCSSAPRNEIAQSEGAAGDGKPFVVLDAQRLRAPQDQKMSKSTGTSDDPGAAQSATTRVLRFFIARAHYRSPPLNYSDEQLADARQSLSRLYTALKGPRGDTAPRRVTGTSPAQGGSRSHGDDFNTPEAVAVLFRSRQRR